MFDVSAIARAHRAFERKNEAMLTDVANEAKDKGLASIRNQRGQFGTTWKSRTGKLVRSTTGRVFRMVGSRLVRFESDAEHGPFIEHGTRPHVITPRRARWLRFYSERAGRIVFAKRVMHPGTPPFRFLSGARNDAHHWYYREAQRRMTALAKQF